MGKSDKERGLMFASKRLQAQVNASTHVAEILWKTAKDIVKAARKYRPYYQSKTMSDVGQYEKEAAQIAHKAEQAIMKYVEAYSLAGGKILKLDVKDFVSNYLKKEVFGKTYMQRNSEYLSNFADDIVKMVRAGVSLRYDEKKLIEAVRKSYKDPYNNSVMTKAAREGKYTMVIPHRGQGIYAASYENIIRNVQNTINLSWGQTEIEYGRSVNAVGYRTYRNSSYPCDICDEIASRPHRMSEGMLIPAHHRCVCGVSFIFDESELVDG